MFDHLEEELGTRAPPARYAFTASPPLPQKHRPKGGAPKGVRLHTRRQARGLAGQLGSLDSAEEALLEAQLGMAPAGLPPHLRLYALQRRNAASFSGPGVLPGEQEAGHIEYKLKFDPAAGPVRFQQLVTQLNWRLSEGVGECLYAVGVEDNGHPRGLEQAELESSLRVLLEMAAEVGATAQVLQMPQGSAEGRRCAVVRVVRTQPPSHGEYSELRVAVAGGVDSGKTTLVGVLIHGMGGLPVLDNGRGSSRMQVFRHKHEIESGHTSSISLQQLAYEANGGVLNYSALSSLSPAELAGAASRVLRFFDLGGHERFSKTALHGLTCMLPDYVLLCVNALTGVSWVTREHLAVALALGIPTFVALTKSDLASEAAVQQAAGEIRSLLAAAVAQGGGAVPDGATLAPLVETEEQAVQLAAGMHLSRASGSNLCVPLFPTSAVTGASLQLLHSFLNALQPTGDRGSVGCAEGGGGMQGWRQGGAATDAACEAGSQGVQTPAHLQIDGSYDICGVGTVYRGTIVSGAVSVGDKLLLGPLEGGSFQAVAVSGIHRSKVAVQVAQQGQHVTVAVQPLQTPSPAPAAAAGEEHGGCAEAIAAGVEADLPARADSASCLHAWMQQSASEEAQGRQPGWADGDVASAALPPAAGSTAAVTIRHGTGSMHSSCSAGQLGNSLGQQPQQQSSQSIGSGGGGLLHHWGSLPQLASAGSMPAPRPRKGAVLLHPSLKPQASVEFEAALVLLGGHWPARGLLSGCYPPEGEGDAAVASLSLADIPLGRSLGAGDSGDGGLAGSSLGAQSLSLGKRSSSRRRGSLSYIPVVHCGSIRQAAQVVAMRELPVGRGWGSCNASLANSGSGNASGVSSMAAAALRPGEEGETQRAVQQALEEQQEEDILAGLLGCELCSEPSGGSSAAGAMLGVACCAGAQSAQHPDPWRLAGAVAAAGVLLPPPLPASCGTSAPSGSSSSHEGEGPALPASASAAARQAAALERSRSLLACEDIGCLAAVTFRFMHNPEWLVEGARLIIRDRTTGRTSGAGYVTAVHPRA